MTTTAPLTIASSHILFPAFKWLTKPVLKNKHKLSGMIHLDVSEAGITAVTSTSSRLHRAIFTEAAVNVLKPLLADTVITMLEPHKPEVIHHHGVYSFTITAQQITLTPLEGMRFPNYKPITTCKFTEKFHTQQRKDLITGTICAKLSAIFNNRYLEDALGYGSLITPSKCASGAVYHNLGDSPSSDMIEIRPEMPAETAQLSAFIMPARSPRSSR